MIDREQFPRPFTPREFVAVIDQNEQQVILYRDDIRPAIFSELVFALERRGWTTAVCGNIARIFSPLATDERIDSLVEALEIWKEKYDETILVK